MILIRACSGFDELEACVQMEIEISVLNFQRIEGPLHVADAALERILALL